MNPAKISSDTRQPNKRHWSLALSLAKSGRRGRRRPTTVEALIRKKKWKDLRDFLSTKEGREQVLRRRNKEDDEEEVGKEAPSASAGTVTLHAACERGAPVDIVRTICELRPDLPSSVDSRGRTPLHCSCAATALHSRSGGGGKSTLPFPEIVSYLLTSGGGRKSIKVKDIEGRTPLHLALGAGIGCDCGCCSDGCRGPEIDDDSPYNPFDLLDTATNADEQSFANGAIAEIIELLSHAGGPSTATEEDVYGLTPMEYALKRHGSVATSLF